MRVEAGIEINGSLATNINYTKENDVFGFYSTPDINSMLIGGELNGEIVGNLNLVNDLVAYVRGALKVTGHIGSEHSYESNQNFTSKLKSGGDIQVTGEITTDNIARKLWKYITNEEQGATVLASGNIWPKDAPMSFGDGYPSSLKNMILVDATKTLKTFKEDWFFDIPQFGAQPEFATRGNDVAVVWMEADSEENFLRFTKLDSTTNKFTKNTLIVHNDNSISNPKVALFANGDAIITWTQNRFDETNMPSKPTFEDIIAGQDIWFAIYDNETNTVSIPIQLQDNSDINQSLKEGNANVSAGTGDEALITWEIGRAHV